MKTEFVAATALDILSCFRLILGRAPNSEELPGHLGRVGEPLPVIVSSFLNSAEFASRNLLKSERPTNIVRTEYEGFSIFADNGDAAVGRHVAAKRYEPEVEAIFRKYLKPGMSVIDIGANIGFFAMLSRSIVGADGYVIAVEPNIDNVRMIEASRRVNKFDNIEVLGAAASDRINTLALHAEYSNGSVDVPVADQIWTSVLVPAVVLDGIVGPRKIDLIKIDVEGREAAALRGAASIIRKSQPIIISEFSATGIDGGADAYLDFLLHCGYLISVIQKTGEPIECGRDKAQVIAEFHKNGTDHIDLLARSAHLSNRG